MATAKLNVNGMHCGHCQEKVAKALRSVAGVYSAIVDWPTGEAEVDFNDDTVTTERLLVAVKQAGYEAKLAG
jgi:copper chaperone CopZ